MRCSDRTEGDVLAASIARGRQRWGDHLFDLAWFGFWSAWYPNLDIAALRTALQDRWATDGYQPQREADRTTAGLVYIVLEHLVYNAVVGRWSDLDEVVDRMEALDLIRCRAQRGGPLLPRPGRDGLAVMLWSSWPGRDAVSSVPLTNSAPVGS